MGEGEKVRRGEGEKVSGGEGEKVSGVGGGEGGLDFLTSDVRGIGLD